MQRHRRVRCTLDDDLFSGGRSKVKLTRSQKRAQKQLHQHKMGTGALDISAVELQVLQKEDPSVANLKVGAGELQETHYYHSDGLLYRQWIPRGVMQSWLWISWFFLPSVGRLCSNWHTRCQLPDT